MLTQILKNILGRQTQRTHSPWDAIDSALKVCVALESETWFLKQCEAGAWKRAAYVQILALHLLAV